MSEDEFDNIPDDFANIQGVDWAQVLAGPSGLNPTSVEEPYADLPQNEEGLLLADSSRSSTDYFEEDDDYNNLDPSVLAELNRIEEGLTEAPIAPQHPYFVGGGITAVVPQTQSQLTSDSQPSLYLSAPSTHPQNKRKDLVVEEPARVSFKKQRLDDSCLTSPKGKGKLKASDDILQRILSAYEDEITCPICCDFYVLAHISNPCGHSFCGSCGWEWHKKNRSCPVCRTCLKKGSPMIPNITIDNVVEKHIQALALSGDRDWEPGGFKAEEWYKRKQNGARERESSTAHRTRTFIPTVIDLDAIHVLQQPNPPTQVTSDMELIPRPIRRTRRPRRVTGPTMLALP